MQTTKSQIGTKASVASRYLRNSTLIKQSYLDELTIIGAGGVGSALVMNAAIMGFKRIHVWDFDNLEPHNLSTTTYPEEYLGLPKVEAAKNQAELYNKSVKIFTHNEEWVSGKYLSPIVMMAPDNMEVRYSVYLDWYHNNTGVLIDMRMGALTMEVISVMPEHNNYVDTWKPSNSIRDEECTAKHTIFTASIVSGIGLAQAFNCLHHMQYWQYIWMSLSPFSFKKEGLILNKKGEKQDGRSQQSDREVVTGTSQRSDVVLHRPTEDGEDNSSVVLEYERL